MTAPAVAALDRRRADRLTAKLAGAVDLMLDAVVEAYEGRVWEVYGLAGWSDYTAAKVPGLAVIGKGLPLEQRRDAVAVLRGRGLSLRGVAEVLGIGANTVKRDAEAAGVVLASVTSLDGRVRPASAPTPARRRRGPVKTDRAVTVLAGAGPDGLTVREVAAALRCPQHEASATLTRLVQAGRIAYLAPERRGQFGRYTTR